jgi:hypothetical protein
MMTINRLSQIQTGFVAAAGLSILGSIALWASGKRHSALFVGLWPPTFMALGNFFSVPEQEDSIEQLIAQGFDTGTEKTSELKNKSKQKMSQAYDSAKQSAKELVQSA